MKRLLLGLVSLLLLASGTLAQQYTHKYYSSPPTYSVEGQGVYALVDANGRAIVTTPTGASSSTVQGTAADDAASVGNPVGVGGRYESTINTVEDGDVSWLKVDANGRLLIAGSAADNAAAVGNPIPIGGLYQSTPDAQNSGDIATLRADAIGQLRTTVCSLGVNSCAAASLSTTDDIGLSNVSLFVRAFPMVFDGTDMDRQRSIISAMNSVGTGIAAAGLVAQLDDTSPNSVSENQFAPVRINSQRALYVEEGPFSAGRVTADGQIKGSGGFIHTVSIAPTTATPTAGLVTIYNNTAESGTVLYSEWVFATTPGHTIILDMPAGTGIYVGYDATLANVSVSVSYR